MCFDSSASSSQSSRVNDSRTGADNGGIAVRAAETDTLIIGSDDTAQLAIESTTNALTTSADLIQGAFSEFLNITDKRLERADQNIASQQATTAELLSKEQESADDRLIKLFQMVAIAGVAIVTVQSGLFKDIAKAVK